MKRTSRSVTAEELLRMKGDLRRELIHGEVREMTPAGGEHGAVTAQLHGFLWHHVYERRLGRVFSAETGFILERDPDTVRAPDCAFVRGERLPGPVPKKYLSLLPDLAVETLSPDDRPGEVDEKVSQWIRSGVPLVWVLDPGKRTVTAHRPGRAPRVLTGGDVLEGEDVIPGFLLELSRLWL